MTNGVEAASTTVALVGCPNVGKSVVFSELATAYADVSNYAGTTIETTTAATDDYRLIDTPGVHGISSFNEEERITREVALSTDIVINVVDATQLNRDLFLTLQLLDMGIPTVVALNLFDEAEADGIDIDVAALETRLGVPVVPTVAITGAGIEDLRERIPEAAAPESTPIERYESKLPDDVAASRAKRVLLLEGDEQTAQDVQQELSVRGGGSSAAMRETVYRHRRDRVESLVKDVCQTTTGDRRLAEIIDRLLVRPATGTPIAVGLLVAIFYVIGVGVAQTFVGFTESIFTQYYIPNVTTTVKTLVPQTTWGEPTRFILINEELGLVTTTVQYVVGVLLPLVASFYLVIGALEDSGVLPRLAVLADRGLGRVGLNGRAVVPLIIGVGCVTMAVVTTRMVGSRRDRIIATALLGLGVPCSAQIGVIVGLLAGLGLQWWAAYLLILLTVLGVVGMFLDRVLPGEREPLLTELPPVRVPQPRNIVRKTAHRTRRFLLEAGRLFGATAVVVSGGTYLGALDMIVDGFQPLTSVLGLPREFGRILVVGLIRRDFAAAGMTDLALSNTQTFVGLLVITLFVPCILSMGMILEERGWKTALTTWVGSWVVAFGVGSIVAAVLGVMNT
ncbi:ferrous iron transport protein B [Halobaculum sp. MBLA0147]|uniref:ferrous iron transport protein B n=1 Tax=Halobaculum sp. MBLA0147 TaxID=3079934 RepID=UPI0035255BAA